MIEYRYLFFILFYLIDFAFILIMFFAERVNPNRVLVWALFFILVPHIGFLLYLCVGQTFYSRRLFHVKGMDDRALASRLISPQDEVLESEVQNPEYLRIGISMVNAGGMCFAEGNDIRLYLDGNDKFRDLFADIRAAKKFIHLEYFILRNDRLGNDFMHLLTEKVKEGVEVRLLADHMGLNDAPKKAIDEFVAAGGHYEIFHNVLYLIFSPKKNNRNHRKLAYIDGKIAYCGGFNIADDYLGNGRFGYWRDTGVRIVGPTARAANIRFMMDWSYASKTKWEDLAPYGPEPVPLGNEVALLVSGGPDTPDANPVRLQYLTLINESRRTLYLHSPYFMPDKSFRDALILAAKRGVDVRIIIPDKPDHRFVYWNNLVYSKMMIQNGIRMYMYNRGFVHSKTFVVDGELCSIGSANVDDRSLFLDFETNAMVFSKEIGKQMEVAFMKDLEYCTEMSVELCDAFRKTHRIRAAFSNLFRNLI